MVAYYINLDRVPERRDYVENHFSRRGISDLVRLSATDAKDATSLENTHFVKGIGSRWDMPLSAIACFESHRRVWQMIIDAALPAAAIFEDDLRLSETAANVIAGVIEAAETFDVVKIDYSPQLVRLGPEQVLNGIPMRLMLHTVASAGGYVLSRSGCLKLLKWSERYCETLDDFVFFARQNWTAYQLIPAVAIQFQFGYDAENKQITDNAGFHTNERESDPSINAATDKGPLGFRLRKEFNRFTRKNYWRFGGDTRLIRRGGYIGHVPLAPDLQFGNADDG